MTSPDGVRLIGRYALHDELASGGMAAVHLGRLLGPAGFARTVAIKRLHSHLARDPEFVRMFLDEARLVSRIKHPNVVPTLDIVALDGELFLVMEYVHGAPVNKILMALARRSERMPVNVAVGITVSVLEGLHAAHEATSEEGAPLDIVHRDVSPQNIIVGADGIARVLDFGIAKAAERLQTTEEGSFKGKLGYMPPDVLCGRPVDRRADLWAAGVVLWEMLVGERLFPTGDSPHAVVRMIVDDPIDPPSRRRAPIAADLDAVVARALMKEPAERFETARAMATALEGAAPVASSRVIGEWLASVVGDQLAERATRVAGVERSSRVAPPSSRTVHKLTQSAPFDLLAGSFGKTSETMAIAPSTVPDAPMAIAPSAVPDAPMAIAPEAVPDAPMATAPEAATDAPMTTAPEAATDAPMSAAPTLEVPVLPVMATPAPPSEAPVPASRSRRRRSLLALVYVLVAAAAAAIAVVVLERRSRPPLDASASASASASDLPHVEMAVDVPPHAEAPLVAPPESAAVEAAPSATPSTSPRGGSTRSAKGTGQGTKTGSGSRPGSAAPKSCNPPYTIGPPPDYIRKPKLECLPQ